YSTSNIGLRYLESRFESVIFSQARSVNLLSCSGSVFVNSSCPNRVSIADRTAAEPWSNRARASLIRSLDIISPASLFRCNPHTNPCRIEVSRSPYEPVIVVPSRNLLLISDSSDPPPIISAKRTANPRYFPAFPSSLLRSTSLSSPLLSTSLAVSAANWNHSSSTSPNNNFSRIALAFGVSSSPNVSNNWNRTLTAASSAIAYRSSVRDGLAFICFSANRMAFSRTPPSLSCNACWMVSIPNRFIPSSVHKACRRPIAVLPLTTLASSSSSTDASTRSTSIRCACLRHQPFSLSNTSTSS